jgi:hypothetical protein
MLFASQRKRLTGEDRDLYFTGAFPMKDEEVVLITGARSRDKKDILTKVHYLYQDGTIQNPFTKTLSPADFERFLNTFAIKVATTYHSNKLVEISSFFKPIDDERLSFLTEENKNMILRTYLLELVAGRSQEVALHKVTNLIHQYKKQHQ